MAYTNATFYLDFTKAATADNARATLSGVVFDNSSGTTVRGTKVAHGLVTGAVITVSGCTQAYANSAWKITRVDDDTFTLDDALWASFTGADVTGDAVPFGGQSWDDAWATMTNGATAARIAPGDTIKIAKSPAPSSSIGHATWMAKGYNTSTSYITSCTSATPIVVTRNNHGFEDGDYVLITGQTVVTAANGIWKVANKSTNTYELEGSVGGGGSAGGATGNVYRMNHKVVVLQTTGQVLDIDRCELASNWSNANGASIALNSFTPQKQGAYSQKIIAPSSPGTATKYAYKAISSTNFADYQAITFWIYNSYAILGTHWKLCLCSDSSGETVRDTFIIPAIPSTSKWLPLTIAKDGGGNMYNGIQSIALYSNTAAPQGSSYIYLDNIMACKTGGINLQSLISKDSLDYNASSDGWYAIQSIQDPVVLIDNEPQTLSTAGRGYFSTTQDDHVDTYIRETTKVAIPAASSTCSGTVNDSGTAGNQISFQGGYDTSTGEQNGQTIIDNLNALGYGFGTSSKNYITLNRLSAVRGYYGLNCSTGTGVVLDVIPNCMHNSNNNINLATMTSLTMNTIVNCSNGGAIGFADSGSTFTSGTIIRANSCLSNNVSLSTTSAPKTITEITEASNGATTGLYLTGPGQTITTVGRCDRNVSHGIHFNGAQFCVLGSVASACYNGSNGINLDGYNNEVGTVTALSNNVTGLGLNNGPNRVSKITACNSNASFAFQCSGNGTALKPIQIIGQTSTTGNAKLFSLPSTAFNVVVNNLTFAENESNIFSAALGAGYDGRCRFTNVAGSATDHRTYTDGGAVKSETTTVHTAGGVAWKWTFSDATRVITYPIDIPVARVLVESGQTVVISAYVYRNNATDAGIRLRVKRFQLAGMSESDITATCTASSSGAWEKISLPSFQPTQTGVVEVIAEGYYIASTSGYAILDDLEVTIS